jgi:hypothetical protein
MHKFKTKVNDLGKAPEGSEFYKRGFTINIAANAVTKPAAAPEPPAKPKRKKKPGKK